MPPCAAWATATEPVTQADPGAGPDPAASPDPTASPDRAASPLRLGILHLGRPESGVRRYARIITDALR